MLIRGVKATYDHKPGSLYFSLSGNFWSYFPGLFIDHRVGYFHHFLKSLLFVTNKGFNYAVNNCEEKITMNLRKK